jgi:hypothetical protein
MMDILISIPIIILVIILLIKKYREHPSDKYNNDSWRKRKSDQ